MFQCKSVLCEVGFSDWYLSGATRRQLQHRRAYADPRNDSTFSAFSSTQFPSSTLGAQLDENYRAAVQELKLDDYTKETFFFTMYPYYGNFV